MNTMVIGPSCVKPLNRAATFIGSYALVHLAIDAACAFLLLGVLDLGNQFVITLLAYNALAFVLQAPLGLLIDKWLNPKLAALLSLMLVASAFLVWDVLFPALILAGVGNALFHVGGGSLVLSIKQKTATFVGLFVAPGAIGLALGTYLSSLHVVTSLWMFPIGLIGLSLLIIFTPIPNFTRDKVEKGSSNFEFLIVTLILIPVIVRSLIGLSVDFPWKEHHGMLWILISAIALGKIVGGMLTDRFGLQKVGVGGMLLSAPLLAFFPAVPILGLFGVFVLNFSMPVTLIAVWKLMPNRRGLAFGLTTVALFMGALPVLLGKGGWLQADLTVFTLLLVSALILFITLRKT
jgi:MFS transporter, FSR family, fosmidomycin resistance protein